jgi:hypothetical protein
MPPESEVYFVVDHSTNALVAVCPGEEAAKNLVANSAANLSVYTVEAKVVSDAALAEKD